MDKKRLTLVFVYYAISLIELINKKLFACSNVEKGINEQNYFNQSTRIKI